MRRAVSLSVLGLLVLLALTRYPVPIYRDHTFLHFPVWEVAAKSHGLFFPLSNPYLNHGAPMASDPNHLLLYPTAGLLKVFPAQKAYSIHFFGHALLSFWLMAFLLMGRLDRTKALILAAFWVLSGPFLSASSSLNLFTAFCWVPGILLAAQRASVPGQVLTLSMAALAGEPAIGLGAAALALVYSPNRKRTLISLGLTALLFLPFFLFLREAFAYSTRMMGGQTWRTALNASLNPVRLPEALLPFLFGVPGTRAAWASFVNPKDFLLPSLGMLWLAIALFEGKRRDWIVLAGLLFLGLGSFNPIVGLLYKSIPQLAWMRFPEKFFLLAAFLLGWRAVDRPLRSQWIVWMGWLAVPAFFLSSAAGAVVILSWITLWLWSDGKPRWTLVPGLAFGLTMAFFTVPLSSDLYSLQEPEKTLLSWLQGQRILDFRDPYDIPDMIRRRYRDERTLSETLFEPPVKEPYYLRRRLFLAPTGMGQGIQYAFTNNTSGSGLIFYDMVREILPWRQTALCIAYGVGLAADLYSPAMNIYSAVATRQKDPLKGTDIPMQVRCIKSVPEIMDIMAQGPFDRSTILLAGECAKEDHARVTFIEESRGKVSSEDVINIALFMRAYSPLVKARVDDHSSSISIAYGALIAVSTPPGQHTVELSEPYPFSLIFFLTLFYVMLLSVSIYCVIRSRIGQGGTPRE